MSTYIDLGEWNTPGGPRPLVWWADSGAVVIGDQDLIAFCENEDDFRRRTLGYEAHRTQRDGLGWLAAVLEGCR